MLSGFSPNNNYMKKLLTTCLLATTFAMTTNAQPQLRADNIDEVLKAKRKPNYSLAVQTTFSVQEPLLAVRPTWWQEPQVHPQPFHDLESLPPF